MIELKFPPKIKIVVEHEENQQLKEIVMKLDEAIAQIKAVSVQLGQAKTEILAKIDELEAATGDLTPEQQAVVDELKASAQSLDDIVPNP